MAALTMGRREVPNALQLPPYKLLLYHTRGCTARHCWILRPGQDGSALALHLAAFGWLRLLLLLPLLAAPGLAARQAILLLPLLSALPMVRAGRLTGALPLPPQAAIRRKARICQQGQGEQQQHRMWQR